MDSKPGRYGSNRPVLAKGEPPSQHQSPPGQHSRGSSSAGKERTTHACDRCRIMRTKCSGGNRCTKCIKDNATCVYGDRKRERNKKDLAQSLDRIDELKSENHILLNALRSLTADHDFDTSRHEDVLEILSKYQHGQSESGHESSSQSLTTASGNKKRRATQESFQKGGEDGTEHGEKGAASSVGSPGRQGELAHVVDLDGGVGASGFVGKMSEISWIQRAAETIRDQASTNYPEFAMGEVDHRITTAKDFSFWMDEADLLAIDEDLVDPYEWPLADAGLILSEACFHALQGTFPFILREEFLQTMFRYPRQRPMPSWGQRRWLAMANLVWAVGAKWLQITKLEQQNAQDIHLLYYARARALGLDHRVLFDHPDIERVQGIGLLAFYLLSNGSITRAWNILGHGTRHATALGLHLKVSDPELNDAEKERRSRTWHALYSLEILLSEITGRPKSIFLSDVTAPTTIFANRVDSEKGQVQRDPDHMSTTESRRAWLDFLRARREISQAMTGGMVPWTSFPSLGHGISPLYFPHRLQLCRLSDKIAPILYSGTADDSWSEVQQKIGEMQTELRHWLEALPDELNLQSDVTVDTDPRAKIELSMYYYSVQMILHRPCLCEIIIENQSFSSEEFNRNSARACVHAGMSLLAIMPDNPSAHEAYQLLPWWSLLHYVAQATAVLMLEMALNCQHFQSERKDVINYLRKAMAYIWCMSGTSLSAYKAWRIFRQLLTTIVEDHEEYDTVDIPEEAPQPPGWTEKMEASVQRNFQTSVATDGVQGQDDASTWSPRSL
ncbi:hypothetical protein LTR10_019617 [Elasticomyces elasticus]|uniref:Zn(2)-C6 fungal-type domain-containing protein n=1 Tax=Exophiala sideris TaxID=1016849 RepID=A0ABR0JFF9_9EURO|nr:hypothetical protein LTR10_019617 [Elasticomyces elasticus]KAK5025807.1 hypothetical protein LTS07_008011 [Exophiala sideris]KAK5032985.1 hypothetical protein LTR13_006950 [Exophiala sideris]KAK5063470.1 hypothetical protein LTR69_004176 [Exophiala sideris]KAK5180698.1 hypothetical protein LTR44_007012 [Eurotiomycetes sp. CCFEE 6388]